MKYIMIFMLVLLPGLVIAQTCNDQMEKTISGEQYIDHGDGAVMDVVTGLIWSKCSAGQDYDAEANVCEGEPSAFATWSDALQSASGFNAAGHSDWRLPNIKELHSIVERACHRPAINMEAFPGTPDVLYWTNTPENRVNVNIPSIAISTPLLARVVDFTNGAEWLGYNSPLLTDPNPIITVRYVRELN